jgi:hypothetical protein
MANVPISALSGSSIHETDASADVRGCKLSLSNVVSRLTVLVHSQRCMGGRSGRRTGDSEWGRTKRRRCDQPCPTKIKQVACQPGFGVLGRNLLRLTRPIGSTVVERAPFRFIWVSDRIKIAAMVPMFEPAPLELMNEGVRIIVHGQKNNPR